MFQLQTAFLCKDRHQTSTSAAYRGRNSRPPTWSSDSTMKQQVTLPAGRATQKGRDGGMGEATSALERSRLRSVSVIHYKRAVECV